VRTVRQSDSGVAVWRQLVAARIAFGRACAVLAVALTCTWMQACTTVEQSRKVVDDNSSTVTDARANRRDAAATQRAQARAADLVPGAPRVETDVTRRAQIRIDLAAGYYQQRAFSQSLEELRAALAIDSRSAQAYGMLGLVYMELGEQARAEDGFRQALSIAPGDSDLLNNYGWFLCQTGRADQAIPQFQAALKDPLYATPARPLHNAGICSLRIGDEVGAESYFLRSFQLDPRNPVSMYNLAEINLKRGDVDRARFYSRRLLDAYPPSAETLWLAIRIERKGTDRDSFNSLSAQLRRLFPGSREAELLQRGAFDG
jgi:type IV pilus assembly protein PilF